MATRRYAAPALLGLLCLGACATQYVPGPGKSGAEYGRDYGHCRLYAHSTRPDTSFEFSGSQKSVAIASGAALLLGGLATVAHDQEAVDDCMLASGWLHPDAQTAAVQPVTAASLPPPVTAAAPAPLDPITERIIEAQRAAEAWVMAENVMNNRRGAEQDRRGLYLALCGAGDRSACDMVASLTPSR